MSALDLPLHVETHGLEPGPGVDSLVLIHGFGASAFSWRYWVPALARRAHVVLVDMKGFGSAPKPDDGRYGPDDQAQLVHHMIRQRDLGRATLVGHSLGGAVSLMTALRLRDDGEGRLRGLVIVGGAAYRQKLPPFVFMARHRRLSLAVFRLLGARRVVRTVLRTIVYDRSMVKESQVEGYAHPLASREGQRAMIDAALQIVPADLDEFTRRYPQIDVPTLLIWGREDRVVPLWVGERLAETLPDCRLEVLEKCGHVPAEEHPKESLALMEDFLDTLDDELDAR
jgi:pimeloyl-ACP methyl ester carboxylesterase